MSSPPVPSVPASWPSPACAAAPAVPPWGVSSRLTSVAMHGSAPYRQVLTHGFVVDAEGRKMAKSVGNVMSPVKIMKRLLFVLLIRNNFV